MNARLNDATALLDFEHADLQALIGARSWRELAEAERIGAIYDYVRDEIAFGYNTSDDIAASTVLADGYGQCNTKTTLLMSLFRGAGIACRFHGATIHERLQKGVVDGPFYRLAPDNIIHSWTEVQVDGRWVGLEGVILDRDYLDGLRASVHPDGGAFLGYGVGTKDLDNPPIAWCGTDTAIQATGVNHDFGTYDDPDCFYGEHGANLAGPKAWIYRATVRRLMNRKVASIRRYARLAVATTTPAGKQTVVSESA